MPLVKAVPRYLQIINYYQGMIDAGKLSEGQQMPTEEAIGALFSRGQLDVFFIVFVGGDSRLTGRFGLN